MSQHYEIAARDQIFSNVSICQLLYNFKNPSGELRPIQNICNAFA